MGGGGGRDGRGLGGRGIDVGVVLSESRPLTALGREREGARCVSGRGRSGQGAWVRAWCSVLDCQNLAR